MVAAVPRNVFGIGIECCRPARVEGAWHTGKGEGVLGRTVVGGVTNVCNKVAAAFPLRGPQLGSGPIPAGSDPKVIRGLTPFGTSQGLAPYR